MRLASRVPLLFTLIASMLVANSARAVVYEVSRSFSEGPVLATLTGTVSVPLGNYVIQNGAPNPFTDVNLTMTVDGLPYSLSYALTGLINGSGQFTVDATASSLVFSATGDGSNPADLVFSTDAVSQGATWYGIGSDSDPMFEAAYGDSEYAVAAVQFPLVFGVAIPEPATIVLLAVAALGAGLVRRK